MAENDKHSHASPSHIVPARDGDASHARPLGFPKFVNRPNLSGGGTLTPGSIAAGQGTGGASGSGGGTSSGGGGTAPVARPWGLLVTAGGTFLAAQCTSISDGLAQGSALFASIATMTALTLQYNGVASPTFATHGVSGELVACTLICKTTPDAALANAAAFIATYVGAVNNYSAGVSGYVATTATGNWPTVSLSFNIP